MINFSFPIVMVNKIFKKQNLKKKIETNPKKQSLKPKFTYFIYVYIFIYLFIINFFFLFRVYESFFFIFYLYEIIVFLLFLYLFALVICVSCIFIDCIIN